MLGTLGGGKIPLPEGSCVFGQCDGRQVASDPYKTQVLEILQGAPCQYTRDVPSFECLRRTDLGRQGIIPHQTGINVVG